MRLFQPLLSLAVLAASLPLSGQSTTIAEPPALLQAEQGVSADHLREVDKFISADSFQGRYPGLLGGKLAAEYIADQFRSYGLTPAGDNGTYLQKFRSKK